jgi:tRNA(Ile)-lysidine synthase
VLQKLLSFIREHRMLRAGDRLGIAVSGGADSVALLRAMLVLRGELGLVLSAVHVHHGIRGSEADSDAAFVEALAREHSLDLHHSRVDAPAVAREKRLSLEAAGRHVRYEYFNELIDSGVLDKIATAHTFDDQAETVLLRILRGAGLTGIAGIYPTLDGSDKRDDRKVRIIRPLLGTRRPELLAYLASLNQSWREDATNADVSFSRNRVRHELLPLLERDYNPAVRDVLNNLAEIARADSDFVSDRARTAALDIVDLKSRQLRVAPLLQLPVALQRQVLIFAASSITDTRLTFEEVEDLRRLAGGEISGRDLPGGVQVGRARVGDSCVLCFESASAIDKKPTNHDYQYAVPAPGEVYVPESGDLIRTTLVSWESASSGYNAAASLDASLVTKGLTLRNWRPGDRFRPLHSKNAEKLKRLFQEKKVPQNERTTWPVLLHGDDIIWVRGFPVSAEYRVRSGARSAIVIDATRPHRSK